MQSGQYNRRIQVQTQTTSQDTFGQPQQAWQTTYSCWANIDVQASQLIYSTSEFISKVTHRITVRWTPSFTFTPKQRLAYTEAATGVVHVYEIEAFVNVKEANREVMILCYELDGMS